MTLQRKSHMLEDEKEFQDTRRPPYRRRRWQVGIALEGEGRGKRVTDDEQAGHAHVHRIESRRKQHTDYHSAVAGAVHITSGAHNHLPSCSALLIIRKVRSRLQFDMRYPDTRRTVHALLFCRYCSGLRRSRTYSHIRGHWGAGPQSGSAAGASRKTAIHAVDGRTGCSRSGDPCRIQSHEATQPVQQQQSADAPLPWNGLRKHQRRSFGAFPLGCQVCGRASRTDDRGRQEPVQ